MSPSTECVGSLMVSTKDMQELSGAPAPAPLAAAGGLIRRFSHQVSDAMHHTAPRAHEAECVGTLLVKNRDMQELSAAPAPAAAGLVRRWSHQVADAVHHAAPSAHQTECVGTLLVDTHDLQELSGSHAATAPGGLVRRITQPVVDTLNAPANEDPKDLSKFGMHQ